MSSRPSVAVVIPAWNAAEHIRDALVSIDRNDPHSVHIADVLVVDDGSTDDTADVVGQVASTLSIPVRLLRQENCGVAAARNLGILASSSDLVAFLDADDLWLRGSLDTLADHLLSDQTVGVVMGGFERTQYLPGDIAGQVDASVNGGELTGLFGASLMRRWAFDRVGLLDPSKRTGEDFDWFFRAKEERLVKRCRTTVLHYRDRHDSLTSTVTNADRARAVFAALHRRSVQARSSSKEG